jgi:hypothetical protein
MWPETPGAWETNVTSKHACRPSRQPPQLCRAEIEKARAGKVSDVCNEIFDSISFNLS